MPSAAIKTTAPTPSDSATGVERLGHTMPHVAQMLDVGVRTDQRMVASGELEAVRFAGRTVRVTDKSVRALFESTSAKGRR